MKGFSISLAAEYKFYPEGASSEDTFVNPSSALIFILE